MQNNRGVIGNIAQRPGAYLITFVMLFVIMVGFMAAVDALPEAPAGTTPVAQEPAGAEPAAPANAEAPVRVVAKSVNMDVSIENPGTTDIAVLDDALLRGAVRWPESAMLGVEGTVFLFGHSSYLPVVYNQAYKAFNKIQDLKTGDTISVYSATTEYRYAVRSVRLADASEDVIELPQTGRQLILVTCDSFGRKTSRFVVTAELLGTFAVTP
jgi:LPXTG-site transpeptidase (sortase) family protein